MTRKPSLPIQEEETPLPLPPGSVLAPDTQSVVYDPSQTPDTSLETPHLTPLEKANPTFTIDEPTPDLTPALPAEDPLSDPASAPGTDLTSISTSPPLALPRKQSLANNHRRRVLHTLVESEKSEAESEFAPSDYSVSGPMTVSANMPYRKVWVKRLGQSATMVTISEDNLVDDAKDMVLKKYANSLGRLYDAPDLTLRIVPRDSAHRHGKGERTLGPEELLSRTLDAYFPGGQNVDEALIIDVPQRRTPRHSPHIPMSYYANDDLRPSESGGDYFPTLPIQAQPSPRLPSTASVASGHGPSHPPLSHAMSIMGTGSVPTLPSPGQLSARHSNSAGSRSQRPRYPRQHTASPTVIGTAKPATHGGQIQSFRWYKYQLNDSLDTLNPHPGNVPAPPPLPSPQIPSEGQPHADHTATPPRVASPRPSKGIKKSKKALNPSSNLPTGLLDGAVPPINVLIVEDNIINLKLLEAFMKRLKVRWHTAMNGREAVNKWRRGGFHLVLMDIQLPVMNGLDATKEIRRLEKLNRIGVFSNSTASTPTFANSIESIPEDANGTPEGEDSLMNTALFKSPVIIVALTASSLQSDRHEALAAGCNDFLTKPVNFVWLERKVMEWGCMQALIDFDGWRKWKDFSQAPQPSAAGKQPSPSAKNASGTAIGGANGAVNGERKKSLGMLQTGAGGKKEKRLSVGTEGGVGSTSGSGSEGSGNGSTITAGA
ncbi:MAG: hypothetical protein LQ343_003600 [Gyalolechia ehrenbergii]|nr:MAG: hypothetical protein LQ343_003600 [Gyalolechia ehrenbergii]